MGMRASIEQISPQRLSEFLANPRLAYEHMRGAISQSLTETLRRAIPEPDEALRKSLAAIDAAQRSTEDKARMREVLLKNFANLQERLKADASNAQFAQDQKAEAQPAEEIKVFPLEKDWHVLHYVLNGTTEGGKGPLADAVLGGKEIPDADQVMGYGPMRYLSPLEVEAVAEALAAVDSKQLLARLDPEDAESKHIYLSDTLDDPDEWSYLPEFFEQFRAFYAEAAKNGKAMLLYIT